MSAMEQNLDIRTTVQQGLYLTPQLTQSLAMLQMPIQELTQEINVILQENPILEALEESDDGFEEDFSSNDDEEADEKQEGDIVDKISTDDWQEYIGYERMDDISYRSLSDENDFNYENFIASQESLQDHLLWQLGVETLDKERRKIGEFIIGNLTEDGYFRLDPMDSAEEIGVSYENFVDTLGLIRSFTPVGIASTSLPECILMQINHMADVDSCYKELCEELLLNYGEKLSAFKFDEILKSMQIERDTFDYLLELIKKTDPRPGLNFASVISSNENYVTPDVYIVPDGEGGFDVLVNDRAIPQLRLNSYYTKLLQSDKKSSSSILDDEAKEYIKDKVKQAVWVIDNLDRRQKAIYKVTRAIVDMQKDFLKYGLSKMKPLILKDVAEATSLSESTVSRATDGKYAMTPQGVVELKTFFSKKLEGGEEGFISVDIVKDMIKGLVDNEDKSKCLSDQKIVDLLENKGIKLARRTVTKYREELNIPTMSQRKRIKGG